MYQCTSVMGSSRHKSDLHVLPGTSIKKKLLDFNNVFVGNDSQVGVRVYSILLPDVAGDTSGWRGPTPTNDINYKTLCNALQMNTCISKLLPSITSTL